VTCTSETNTLNSGSVTSRMRVNKTTLYVKKTQRLGRSTCLGLRIKSNVHRNNCHLFAKSNWTWE